jgi:preprotein translocase subunit YajC
MMFAFLAQAGSSGGGGGFLGFLPFILIMVIVYLMMIRPQIKKQKEHGAMLNSLSKNDEVITSGGIHGRIVQMSEKGTSLQVQIAKGIIVTVERSSISRILNADEAKQTRQIPAGGEKPAGKRPGKQPRQPSHRNGSGAKPSQEKQAARETDSRPAGSGVVTTSPTSPSSDEPRRHRPRRRSRRPHQRRDNRPQTPTPESKGEKTG